jgi:hypothetical protein
MMWSFFGQGMGKGPMMVLGQFWKGFSRNHDWVLNGPKLQNAEDVVTLMCIHLSSQPETSYTRERKPITCFFGMSTLLMLIIKLNTLVILWRGAEICIVWSLLAYVMLTKCWKRIRFVFVVFVLILITRIVWIWLGPRHGR